MNRLKEIDNLEKAANTVFYWGLAIAIAWVVFLIGAGAFIIWIIIKILQHFGIL